MADTTTDTQDFSATAAAEAATPDALSGWNAFQRSVNTVLPMRLREMEKLLEQVDRTLAGYGG